MSWKNLKQQSFAEALLAEQDALTELDDLQKLIDPSRIETMLSGIYNKANGGQARPPLLMFKAMLLQSWYKLSFSQVKKQEATSCFLLCPKCSVISACRARSTSTLVNCFNKPFSPMRSSDFL